MRWARYALATGLLLAAAVPGALAAGQSPATASPARPAQPDSNAQPDTPAQPDSSPVRLTITSVTPQWANPGDTITVTGTVTDTSRTSFSHLSVQLRSSRRAVGGLSEMLLDIAAPFPLAGNKVTGNVLQPASELQPGSTSKWRVSFRSARVGMTAFGVYPLTAEADSSLGTLLSYSNTFLPYIPDRHSRYGKSLPARQQVAWVWPLMDVPLTTLPGQRDCSSPQADVLGTSMAAGGRLDGLLVAGGAYTGIDKLTWAVDPALLADASDLSGCTGTPARAGAASSWLSRLKKVTARQHLFVTPYANVSLALIRHSHASDVNTAFALGRQVAHTILNRDFTPPTAASPSDAGTAWPPDDVSSSMLEDLALQQNVRTVVLPSDTVTGAPGTAFTVPEGPTQVHVVLSASSLTQLLTSATSAPGSEFATSQLFLAETALMAQQGRADPVVVAPQQQPQGWQPPAGLAGTLLADTARAPWLAPVPLTSLASSAKATDLQLTTARAGNSGSFSGRMLREIGQADQDVRQIGQIAAEPAPGTEAAEAIAALESADWGAGTEAARLARLAYLGKYLDAEQSDVLVVADKRVTLGGLKGNVPVLIDNRLGYPVKVQLVPSFAQPPGGGLTVQQKPMGVVMVAAHSQRTTTLRVQATQVGSSTITLRLLNQAGQRLPDKSGTAEVTVQATQFGMFGMIILAAALGVFMIASAARAIRRGRPAPPDNPDDARHPDSDASEGSQQPSGPDNVIQERTELGAAGSSGR